MRVLVLGGSGMLGHKIVQTFADAFETTATVREPLTEPFAPIFAGAALISGVTVEAFETVVDAVQTTRPEVVVNCIGVVKQSPTATDPIPTITVNSLFPHRIASLCESIEARFIQISTDCVFSGRIGSYREDDLADPVDLYGKSKLLGEPTSRHALTIRTSIIGRELETSQGLLEWFLSQQGESVSGYTRAIFSGFPTYALALHLRRLIESAVEISGLRHLASEPISKFELLRLIRDVYELDVEIEPEDEFICDRSLDGSHLRDEIALEIQPWRQMIETMYADQTPYTELRGAVPC